LGTLQYYALRYDPTMDKDQKYPSAREDGVRQCSVCKAELTASDEHFYKRKRANGKVYLSSECKPCVKATRKKFHADNRDRLVADMRELRERKGDQYNANRRARIQADDEYRAKRRAKVDEWYKANPEKVIAYRRARYAQFKDQIKAACLAWRAGLPPHRIKAWRTNYKARKRGAPGRYTAADLAAQFDKQVGLCFWCKCDLGSTYHADHYVPLAKGGTNHPANIVLACPTCNTSKRHKMPDEFAQYREIVAANAALIEEKRVYMRAAMRKHRAKKKTSPG
jgi:5-methylcytosine-specific restriction endonuclease McrA